jgi:hypothetical protein
MGEAESVVGVAHLHWPCRARPDGETLEVALPQLVPERPCDATMARDLCGPQRLHDLRFERVHITALFGWQHEHLEDKTVEGRCEDVAQSVWASKRYRRDQDTMPRNSAR